MGVRAALLTSLFTLAACGDNRGGQITVGGTVTGLSGTVIVQNNGGDDLTIAANGTFTFATPIVTGSAYAVTVLANPTNPTQTCSVARARGTADTTDITDVSITCATSSFTVGGTVSGLAGSGLVLQNNAGDDLAISANGTFTFDTPIASAAPYAVTVKTQPSNPSQSCVVTNGSGNVGGSNVVDVTVTCATDKFNVGGTVTGLLGSGLVLQNNGGDDLVVTADGAFTFPTRVSSGGTYAVTVLAKPTTPSQTCVVTAGTGSVTNQDITSVVVTCSTDSFTVGGTVTGLAGSGLVLQNNGGDDLPITSNGTFTFTTPVASGAAFAVTVLSQPSGVTQTCTVMGGSGTVGNGPVTSVAVDCTTDEFTISGTISGLAASVTLQNNGGDDRVISSNGTFAFTTTIPSGGSYDVTVLVQPTSPSQTCLVTAGSGTVTNADITDVVVTCTTNAFKVGGTVSGLAPGESVTLQNNGADDLIVNADGSFEFTTKVLSGGAYAVTVLAHPASPISQTCDVTSGTGLVGNGDVTSVVVTCTTNTFTIGGSVSGLVGAGLVLRNNGGDDLTIMGNGSFTFTTPVASGATYAVTVQTQPTGQTCTVANGSGTVAASNVTTVSVTCVTPILYVLNEGAPSSVSAYSVASSGVLTPLSGSPFATGGNGGFNHHPDGIARCGNFMYAVNSGGSNTIAGFSVLANGALTPLPGSPYAVGASLSLACGPANTLYKTDFASSVSWLAIGANGALTASGSVTAPSAPLGATFDPSSNRLFVASWNNNLNVFNAAPATGVLTAATGSPVITGGSNHSASVSPDGRFVATEGNNSVRIWSVAANGAVAQVAGSPFADPTPCEVVGLKWSPDSRRLFVGHRGCAPGRMMVYDVNATTGALTAVAGSPFSTGGTSPVSFAIDRLGTRLFVGHQSAGIAVMNIGANGALTPVTGSPFATPGSTYASWMILSD